MQVVAHRGVAGHAAENSLGAIRAALAAGLDFIEVDVRLSRDRALFLLHDATLDRTTSGAGRLADLSAEEASRLSLRGGEPLPRLEDALALCRGRAVLCLDVKETNAEAHLLSVLKRGCDGVEVWSERERVVAEASACGLRTTLISSGLLPRGIGEFLWRARECGAAAVSFYPADIEPHVAAACRNAAMPFLCGTPNDEATWRYLLGAGASAAITDRPLDCRCFLEIEARGSGRSGVP